MNIFKLSLACFAVGLCSILANSSEAHIEVYAHRGARAYAPENTIPGYHAALRMGAHWVDMDVILTKDHQVLVSHDPILNPDITRDSNHLFLEKNSETLKSLSPSDPRLRRYLSKYVAKNLTLSELMGFDVGRLNPDSSYAKFFPEQLPVDDTSMPTLRSVIQEVRRIAGDQVGFQIEMKNDPIHPMLTADPQEFAQALYKVMREEGIVGHTEVQAFDYKCLFELQKLDQKVHTAYLTSRMNEKGAPADFFHSDPAIAKIWTGGLLAKDYGSTIPEIISKWGGSVWGPEDFQLTQESLKQAHDLGLKVVVWSWPEKLGTAFDPELTIKMIEWGVDGIITDDPARLSALLAARGMPLPPRFEFK